MKFEKMLETLLKSPTPGIVILGRSGVGKSTFLHYLALSALKLRRQVIILDWTGEHTTLPLPTVRGVPWTKFLERLARLVEITVEGTAGTAATYIARRVVKEKPSSIDDAINIVHSFTSSDRQGALAVIRRLEIMRDFIIDEDALPKSFVVDFSTLTEEVAKIAVPMFCALLCTMMREGLSNTVIFVEEAWRTELQKSISVLLRECRKYNNKAVLVYQMPPQRGELLQCDLVVFDLGSDSVRYLLQHTWPLEISRLSSKGKCYVYLAEGKKWQKVRVPTPTFTLKPKVKPFEGGTKRAQQSKREEGIVVRDDKVQSETVRGEERDETETQSKHEERTTQTKIPVQVVPKIAPEKTVIMLESIIRRVNELSKLTSEVSLLRSENQRLHQEVERLKKVINDGMDLSKIAELASTIEVISKRQNDFDERLRKIELAMEKVNELSRTVNKLVDVVKALTLRLEEMEER